MSPVDLVEWVNSAPCQRDEDERARPADPIRDEAAVMALREAMARYAEPCPFAPGDLVTPVSNAGLKASGNPHIVLEVFAGAAPFFIATEPRNVSDSRFGRRLNVRVLAAGDDGDLVPFWVEHWTLERWQPAEGGAA